MVSSVSVVVPARDDADGLPHAVASALGQTGPPGVFTLDEVLVVVGPSLDDTAAVAARLAAGHPHVAVVENPHGGIPQALNLGLARAAGDVLARVDAHSVLPPGYLHRAVVSLGETGAANVGAIQAPVGATPRQRAIAAAMRHPLGSGGAGYRAGGERRPVDTAFLGVFRVAALQAVGGWDEAFARNEDAELNLRLARHGHEVWLDPGLVVEYRPRATFRDLAQQYWRYGWWRQRTVRRHRQASARQAIPPAAVLALAASVVLAVLVSPWFVAVPAGYLTVLAAAAVGARDLRIRERVDMVVALAIMHLAWGTAFVASALVRRARFGPTR